MIKTPEFQPKDFTAKTCRFIQRVTPDENGITPDPFYLIITETGETVSITEVGWSLLWSGAMINNDLPVYLVRGSVFSADFFDVEEGDVFLINDEEVEFTVSGTRHQNLSLVDPSDRLLNWANANPFKKLSAEDKEEIYQSFDVRRKAKEEGSVERKAVK